MKKALIVTSALSLTLVMAAGCQPAKQAPGSSAQSTAAKADDKSEKIKIEMMAPSWTGGGWPDNNHPIIQYIDKKFNVDLQIQWVPNANFAEKLSVVAASGKMPDAIRLDSGAFLKWVDEGVFLDLQPYLSEYPTLKSIAQPEEWSILNPPGKIYGIPIYETAQNSLYVRSDWMANLGIPMPDAKDFTIDKFYEIAKAFTTQDPDKNGKQDTFGFSALGNSLQLGDPQLLAAFGIANGWKKENGTLVPMQTQAKEWTQFLTFMHKAYEEGVLDKDFITNTNFNDKYAQGKVGFAIDMHYQFSQQTNQQLQKIAPNAKFVELVPPIGQNGVRGTKTPTSGMLKLALSKDMDEKKRQRMLEMLNWWVSPEGEDIIKNGIEGVHYQKKADGSYEMTDALKAEGEGRQSLLWNWMLRGNSNTFNIYKWSDPKWSSEMEKSISNAKQYPYKNASDGYLSSSDTFTKQGKALDDKFLQTVLEIIAGKKPVDSIDAAISDWKKNGGDKIIQEVNAAYKAKN
jgi:putative aldouronate transport system substrate-binding protein